MTFGPTKSGKLGNIIMHNLIWANQKTDIFCVSLAVRTCNVCRNMLSHICDGASDVISNVLSIRHFIWEAQVPSRAADFPHFPHSSDQRLHLWIFQVEPDARLPLTTSFLCTINECL